MADDRKEQLPLMDDFNAEDTLLSQLQDEEEAQEEESKAKKEDVKEEQKPSVKTEDDQHDEKDEKFETAEDLAKSKDLPEGKKEEESEEESEEEEEEDKKPSQDEGTFWSDVEKLTGRELKVDYEGVDPETPEGAAVREEVLVQTAIEDHLNYLQRLYPREFRALEYAANGGSIDDLFKAGEPDYSKMELPEEDQDYQKQFMTNYYVDKKGFTRQRAQRMVDTDIDSEEGLYKTASEALKEMSVAQEKEREVKVAEQKRIATTNRQQDMQMIGVVEDVVQKGKLGKFTVPTKEREDFYSYSLNHIQRNPEGGYMFVMPLDPRSVEQQLQELYFTYKQGDLTKIIQREAKSENSRRLKRNALSDKPPKGSTEDTDDQRRTSLPTMEDHTVA